MPCLFSKDTPSLNSSHAMHHKSVIDCLAASCTLLIPIPHKNGNPNVVWSAAFDFGATKDDGVFQSTHPSFVDTVVHAQPTMNITVEHHHTVNAAVYKPITWTIS